MASSAACRASVSRYDHEPVTVTIHYAETDVDGLDEEMLELRYSDGDAWSDDGITLVQRNLAQDYAAFAISRLSKFALFWESTGDGYTPIHLPVVLRQ